MFILTPLFLMYFISTLKCPSEIFRMSYVLWSLNKPLNI